MSNFWPAPASLEGSFFLRTYLDFKTFLEQLRT